MATRSRDFANVVAMMAHIAPAQCGMLPIENPDVSPAQHRPPDCELTLLETNMRTLLAFAILAVATPAFAGPHCTKEPVSSWLPKDAFKEKVVAASGFKVAVFKVTTGNCYELYGRNKAGKRIEIYYHPVTGAIVKSHAR